MSVLNDLTKVVTDTAKTVGKKSSDIMEVTKLNLAISSEEEKIEKQLFEIGRKVYLDFSETGIAGEDVIELCKDVQFMENSIADMKTRILGLRKIKECPQCKEMLELDMAFCFKCGTAQPIETIIVEVTEEETEQEVGESAPEGETIPDEEKNEENGNG